MMGAKMSGALAPGRPMKGGCCESGADCAAKGGCTPARGSPNCGGPPNGGEGCCRTPKLGGIDWDDAAEVAAGCPGSAGRGPPS
jgi:hypothetical protein